MGSGREIPLNKDLRSALVALHNSRKPNTTDFVIYSERGTGLSANVIAQWFLSLYRKLGYVGCSSHSGRRTFITTAARQIGTVGGSLRDVQQMAGHQSLQMTAAYIEGSTDAKRRLVNQI
jgi:integrase